MKRRSSASRWMLPVALASVALAVVGAAASCGKCGGGSEETKPVVDEPVAPVPERLLADVYMGSPNTSWSKLQRGIGGPVGILPASAGGILCAAVGIDPAVAFEVDGSSPAYAVLAGDPASPAWAFALKLANVPRARAILVEGDTARFTPREANGYTEMLPKGNAPAPQGAVALSKNGFLVVARKAEELPQLAPYVSRTLPKKAPPDGAIVADVPRAAIASVIKPKLEASWADAKRFLLSEDDRMRKEHGGRAPDYGDPQAIVAALDGIVSKRIEVLGDLDRMRIAIDTDEQSTGVNVTMTPAPGDGPAKKWIDGMRTGDATAVMAMPASAALAMSMRDSDDERAAQADGFEKALTSSLGSRLSADDAKRVHDVVADATKARGETMGLALTWDEPSGMFLRANVRDGEAASRSVKSALELARIAPFKELLRVKDVASSSDEVAGVGKASVATITREPKPGPKAVALRGRDGGAPLGLVAPSPSPAGDGGAPSQAKPNVVGVAWVVDKGALSLATGEEPVVTLRLGAKPDKKLADEPQAARAIGALGTNASTIVVAQPLRFDPSRANLPASPVVLAVGKKEKDAFLRIDLSMGILREASRFLMGL